MSGKILGVLIVVVALVFGGAMYYMQVYAFYEEVEYTTEMEMINLVTGQPEAIIADELQAIDATSSPLRFRGCFTTTMSQALLTETYETYENATPLIAPDWFDCFDAVAIGEALERGDAIAFLGQKSVHNGVDRVIAIFPDGRAFAWNQLNEELSE